MSSFRQMYVHLYDILIVARRDVCACRTVVPFRSYRPHARVCVTQNVPSSSNPGVVSATTSDVQKHISEFVDHYFRLGHRIHDQGHGVCQSRIKFQAHINGSKRGG